LDIKKNLVIKILCNLKFAIVLFALLVFCILLGSFFPQENLIGSDLLIEKFGRTKYLFFKIVGLVDVFNSWWYLLLAFLLYVSLITVSFKKVFPQAKKAFLKYKALSTQSFYQLKFRQENKKKFFYKVLEAKTEKQDLVLFKLDLEKKGYRVDLDQSKYSLVAQKNQIFRLSASVTHVGILIIMLASFLNLLLGFNGLVFASPGDKFSLNSENQVSKKTKVFHSRFWLGRIPLVNLEITETREELDKSGAPKQWVTRLRMQDQKLREIRVNKPVRFAGVDFYQADWREYFKFKFNQTLLRIKAKNAFAQKKTKIGKLEINKELQLFFFKAQNSPQINLVVLDNSRKKNYQNFLFTEDQEKQINDLMKIEYLGLQKETVLQIKYRPFDWLIYFGMFFLVLGVVSSLIKTKLIWIILNVKEQKIESLSLK